MIVCYIPFESVGEFELNTHISDYENKFEFKYSPAE